MLVSAALAILSGVNSGVYERIYIQPRVAPKASF